MLATTYYFLQVLLCSALMMGYYWLVLRNKRFHQYNRFYLLMAAIVSWLVPLVKIQWGHTEAIQFLNVVANNNSQMDVIIADSGFRFNWSSLAISVYFLVAGILLIGMLHAFYRLYHLLKTHSYKSVGEVYLVLTQAKGTPFSFFRYIFWNEEIDIRSDSGKQILQHELTHVQEKHSFDKVLMQVVLIAGWFNPFFWMIKKELEMIHEFIADRKAVKAGDTAALAQMLLASIYPQQQFALTNPFFFSPIKRRLKMLANQQNPRFSYIRRVVVLPLLAIVIVLFAFRNKDQKMATTISVESVLEQVVMQGKELLKNSNLDTAKPNKPDSLVLILDGKGSKIIYSSIKDTSAKPLLLIDYKKVSKEEADQLDPTLIATVDVLKEERSKAVYGEEGKNGVILITTKVYANEHKASSPKISSMPANVVYIVDGVKMDSTILKTLDPNQIQSINVLKNESAKALYGEEGIPGVILITTKAKANPSKGAAKVMVSDIYLGQASVIGYNDNPDPAMNEFMARNTNVKKLYWWAYRSLKMQIELKDGTEETYDLSNPESKQKAEAKYGKLPIAPPPPPPTVSNTNSKVVKGFEIADVKLEKVNNEITVSGSNLEKTKYQPSTTYSGPRLNGVVKPLVNVSGLTNKDTHATLVGFKAQANANVTAKRDTDSTYGQVFTVSQAPATFPGGDDAWKKYLQRNMNLNLVVENGAAPGTYKVDLSFIVDKAGNLSEVKAESDPGYGTKVEAIKLISKGPKWIPAKLNGKPVVYRAKKTITWVVTEE